MVHGLAIHSLADGFFGLALCSQRGVQRRTAQTGILIVDVFIQLRGCRMGVEQRTKSRTRFNLVQFIDQMLYYRTVLFRPNRLNTVLESLKQLGQHVGYREVGFGGQWFSRVHTKNLGLSFPNASELQVGLCYTLERWPSPQQRRLAKLSCYAFNSL